MWVVDEVMAEKGTWENLAKDNATMATASDGSTAVFVGMWSRKCESSLRSMTSNYNLFILDIAAPHWIATPPVELSLLSNMVPILPIARCAVR